VQYARSKTTDPILQALTMLLLDRQSGATAQPRGEANHTGVLAGRVQLRLRADGQLFELPPGKTTIGSSPRCNVRIEQPGVQPLHCLIVDGVDGLRVRSWVANTTLNGMPFEESALAVGDCLSLGPVELEVIDPLAVAAQPKTVEAPVVESKDAELVREGRDRARARSRRLLDALRHERTSHHELCQQVLKLQESHLDAIAEQNETRSKLESCFAELAEARRQLVELQSVETARRQLADRNEQLGFEIGELSAQINELTHGRAELTQGRQQLADDHAALELQHSRLIEAHDKLQSEIGQTAGDRTAADERIRQLEEQNAQLQSEFDPIANENKTLRAESEHFGEIKSRLQSDIVQLANEKAAADEHNRSLVQQQLQLQREAGHLAEQKAQLEDEREGLCRQNEHLLSEARELTGERGSLAEERASLCQERSELRHQNELLRTRVTQLNDENSAMAVSKLTLVEQCDSLSSEAKQLQLKLAELNEEKAKLVAAKTALADEQKRLAELEREMGAAVAGRDNTAAELYRALLQLAELQERDGKNRAVVEAYELLSKEHDSLHGDADELKEQIARLSEERAAVESAWQALSDEAATLSESQQRAASENAELLARLDEAQQQLAWVQQEHATLASSATELERERAAKLQAEADVAAAIADGERQLEKQERRFAEQAQQFAEQSSRLNEQSRQHAQAIKQLEQQLAVANDSQTALTRGREAAQAQLANSDSHRNEQARRIQELESQLAAAEARAVKAAELAAIQLAAEQVAKAPPIATEQSTEFRWSSAGAGSAAHDDLNPIGHDDATLPTSLVDSTASEAAWDRPASAAEAWHSVGAERSTGDFAPERTVAPWSTVPESEVVADEPSAWGEKVASPAPLDANTFGDDDETAAAEQAVEEVVSSERASAWDQTPAEPETTFADPVFAGPKESVQQQSKPERSSAAKKQEPVSFIERYSHLLVEDGAAGEEKPNRANDLMNARPIVPVVARLEEVTSAPAKTEDEDSIEQYMAKLLQRVRGDSDGGKAAREVSSRMPLNAPTSKPAERSPARLESSAMAVSEGRVEGEAGTVDAQSANSGELVMRRVSSPVPTTNLGALRALANETARLAISRHELRKLRHNAVTKTIVATLAGMTSLWLMLGSPAWTHIQFITACGALLVAAYWAAEAFRTLLISMRLAAYEAPEDTALPIDVEETL
jgi:uncharacterized coiled-coil DUF342 family protein